MFCVHFPDNFDSPYKARNISEFWRRWHMTLSAFLRDYLYIPLGGNRKGEVRRYVNLFVTMLLGGIWHGAGWTFVIWGALHGAYLCANHGYVALRGALGMRPSEGRLARLASGALTFVCVVVGWVFFRAENATAAWRILVGMAGGHGVELPAKYLGKLGSLGDALRHAGVRATELPYLPRAFWEIVLFLGVGYAIVWLAPNTTEIFESTRLRPRRGRRAIRSSLSFEPNVAWGMSFGVLLAFSLASVAGRTEFIYFQF
jgi:alginate O-acetyltransferase complex protein AlgI